MFVNIVGFAIINNKNNLSCYKIDNFKMIGNKDINKDVEKIINDKIELSIFNNKKRKC